MRSIDAPAPSQPNVTAKLRGYARLPHPGPIAIVLAATAGFAALAPGARPTPWEWLALLGAMLGGQLAIGAVNEVVDLRDDTSAKPWKPIPAGLVSVRAALALAAIGLVAMVAGSARFGIASVLLCGFGTGAGFAYDLVFKRTVLSWLPYLVALPLIPIWVWTALGAFDPALLALYPLGACATLAVHVAQALPDVAGDRAAGIRSLTTVLGPGRSLALCWVALGTSGLLALGAAFAVDARLSVIAPVATLAIALALLDAALVWRNRELGIRACFPCVAIATAALGLGWVLALR